MRKEKVYISQETVKRLSLYLRNLRRLEKEGVRVICSDRISELLDVSPAQFRKDLSYFGEFGKRGVGYEIRRLIEELEDILGVNKQWKIVLIGVGRLGSALLRFEGFSKFNLKIELAFDIDKRKIGKVINGVKIEDVQRLTERVKEEGVKVGLISTPPQVAQEIADRLIEGGIKGIMNFAPVTLKIPEDVFITNVDMACELERVIFFLNNEGKVKTDSKLLS
ncbi:MAG: redox-sensing transcriptional repressor Rex [Candidatus Omnitrophota bacterium]|nr:MAG: redox-sensing transcriptional repressor Rex [Candidatus Omnitrophota bacterium]